MPVSSLSLRAGLLANLAVLSFLTPSAFAQYQLEVTYTGDTFFDNFDFFTGPDANNGFVTYEDYCDADANGLISTDSLSGINYMGVDANTVITDPSLGGRAATRIISQQSFTHGLFIVDLNNMPGGVCGTNPGYYTIGKGEFNTVSGTNDNTWDTMSLFTDGPYNAVAGDGTGLQETTACGTSTGCSALNERSDDQSFGTNFNDNNGGIYATQWTSEGVNIWFWAYESGDIIPDDVTNGSPDPTGWGPPVASFESGDASLDMVLSNGKLVFDTNFCGNAINSYWSQSPSCSALAPTCEVYVAGFPADFSQMYWGINSINIYQLPEDMPTTTLATPPSQSKACNANGASSGASTSSTALSSTSAPVSSTSAPVSSTLAAVSSTSIPVASSTGFPSPLGYSYYGCVEDISTRILYSDHDITDPMSVEICAAYCAASDYIVFGVEYGRECYCADAFSATPTIVADSQCSMACSGNANEKCGGPMLLSVYANAPVPFPPAAISSSIVSAQSSAPVASQTSVPLAAQTSAGLGAQSSLAAYTSVGFAAQSSLQAGTSDAASSSTNILGATSSAYAAPSSIYLSAYTSVIQSTQSSAPLAAYTSVGFAAQSSISAGATDAASSSTNIFGATSSIYGTQSSSSLAAYTSVVSSAQSSALLAAFTSVVAPSSLATVAADAASSAVTSLPAGGPYTAPSLVLSGSGSSSVASLSAPASSFSISLPGASSTGSAPSIVLPGSTLTKLVSSSVVSSAASIGYTTETIYSTSTYTILSCASTVTNCPLGSVTTQKYPVSTIIMPVTTPAAHFTTSTVYETTVYTITSCAATVTDCPARMGQLTTETISSYTTICPVTATALPTPPVISHGAPGPSEVFTTVIVTAYTDICPYGLTTMTTSQTQTLLTGAPSPAIPMVTTTVTLGTSTFTLTVPFTLPPPTAAALPSGSKLGNVASFATALPTIAATTSMNVAQVSSATTTVLVVPVPVQTGLYHVGNSSYSGIRSSVAAATETGATTVPTTLMASEGIGRAEWSSAAGVLGLVIGVFML